MGCGGRGAVKPLPTKAGAPQGPALRGLVRRRESEPRDNAVGRSRCAKWRADPASADFEHVADLPLAAWCGLAASLCAFDLLVADMREDGAKVLVLNDGGLRNLPQLVEGGVGQIEPTVADRQPAVGIIDQGDTLARRRFSADGD